MSNVKPVIISYHSLSGDLSKISPQIIEAFGSSDKALGLLLIKDLPEEFKHYRQDCLLKASEFANLEESVKDIYVDDASSWLFGWSHGKEKNNGIPDSLKGSYYNNPTVDTPNVSKDLADKHPVYYRKNIWPNEQDCPGFENAFKNLSRFMVSIGNMVAQACDELFEKDIKENLKDNSSSFKELITSSQCTKARLLHYFPPEIQTKKNDKSIENENDQLWCNVHKDHSLLTVLCPEMFLFNPNDKSLSPFIIPSPSPESGLRILTRSGQEVNVSIPQDCLALQTGEALEVLTSNRLKATPHSVSIGDISGTNANNLNKQARDVINKEGYTYPNDGKISRETMAVFLQPDVDKVISSNGETFGEFTERIIKEHH